MCKTHIVAAFLPTIALACATYSDDPPMPGRADAGALSGHYDDAGNWLSADCPPDSKTRALTADEEDQLKRIVECADNALKKPLTLDPPPRVAGPTIDLATLLCGDTDKQCISETPSDQHDTLTYSPYCNVIQIAQESQMHDALIHALLCRADACDPQRASVVWQLCSKL